MFDIDTLLLGLAKKVSWLGVTDMASGRAVLGHLLSGLAWSFGWAHLCRMNRWWYLTAVVWLGLVLYQEAIPDGHLKRMLNRQESATELQDLKSDVFTKLIGLVGYAAAWL